ncbi:MAG: XTP/dITP diphosphatase [Thermodesulfovibrio sp.]|nr:XTP/dITP diphosphatase [Thermodesulfovibrio sp.]MCX7724448.1 XTP/dITP diphosphatase [Thermodesulfovibrio sp.]MDW7972179.1 XTP/dITP diphosphatase [Thermodesulfovibrio sp.]
MKIVIASRNAKKIEELKRILEGIEINLLSINDFPELEEVEEDGLTFEENALKKARYVCQKTGLPAFSDDSGLEVEALGGKPGVRSARYAGERATDEDNIKKLLKDLEGVPLEKRNARFVCCIALVFPDGQEYIFWGYVKGKITESPRGNYGFGYDPVFIPEGFQKTFAEMEPHEKDKISHRREALNKLKDFLIKLGPPYKQNLL